MIEYFVNEQAIKDRAEIADLEKGRLREEQIERRANWEKSKLGEGQTEKRAD